ncbi:MAG: hypothetical protein JWM59_1558 [Verrucomicrobiales bacterium]|nr:hypothetical protein [Verrucomicrobiales bacterium]
MGLLFTMIIKFSDSFYVPISAIATFEVLRNSRECTITLLNGEELVVEDDAFDGMIHFLETEASKHDHLP